MRRNQSQLEHGKLFLVYLFLLIMQVSSPTRQLATPGEQC
jgi:hypothetical protein